MLSPTYILFRNTSSHQWAEETGPVLLSCRAINEEAAQPPFTSFPVNVSQPYALLSWLDKDLYITDLFVFIDAYHKSPPSTRDAGKSVRLPVLGDNETSPPSPLPSPTLLRVHFQALVSAVEMSSTTASFPDCAVVVVCQHQSLQRP
jgi:hypothetical protein